MAARRHWCVSVFKRKDQPELFHRTWHLLVFSAGHELLSELQQRRFNGSEGGGGGGGGGGQAGEKQNVGRHFPSHISFS